MVYVPDQLAFVPPASSVIVVSPAIEKVGCCRTSFASNSKVSISPTLARVRSFALLDVKIKVVTPGVVLSNVILVPSDVSSSTSESYPFKSRAKIVKGTV